MANYKKQTGIWLDYKEAYIITLDGEKGGAPETKHLLSEIEGGVAKGGVRSKTPWAPQGGIDERGFQDRRRKEEKMYFDKIVKEIDPATDELIIFGPAEAKHGLRLVIEGIKHYHPQLRGVFAADSMTPNQIVAKVKDYFAEKAI